ncbi:hypothetical protein CCR75_008303 [Bremia lactucae]|uniref:UBC core domain-containing protein n=1 Tax=Bremia lactucae TaxID=4779 RepID=A0A976IJF1_BRELC|nr:hypothetical protein CCR75_008303 [Bremia lactucae]
MVAGVRNTAIKRIQGDVREMMTNPSDQYDAAPLETNMFDWHFTLRGPPDSEFEGGIYHGRIILPSDYPFKPPNIMLLTPNGRFEVKKKICLSISAYHPEEWQPAWGVRLILEALISFMPTKGEGAIGALDFSAAERRRLAKLSVDFKCETCGRVADLLPELKAGNEEKEVEKKPSKYAEQIAQLHLHSLESAPRADTANGQEETKAVVENSDSGKQEASDSAEAVVENSDSGKQEKSNSAEAVVENSSSGKQENSNSAETEGPVCVAADVGADAVISTTNAVEAEASVPGPTVEVIEQNGGTSRAASNVVRVREADSVDMFLHYVTIAIVMALFAILYKKLLQMHGVLQ